MSRIVRHAVVVAAILAACKGGAKSPDAAADGVTGVMGAAPAQFSDLEPGDTAAVIGMMRQLMRSIDGGLPAMVQRDTTVSADSVDHHLTLWLENGVPRKLIVVDSATNTLNNSETTVWFMGGDVAVLLQASDAYAFDSDRIVVWTDEALQPRSEVTSELLMAKQAELIGAVQGWLELFGIKPP